MKRNTLFYLITFLLLLISYLFLNNAYEKMTYHTNLSNKTNADYGHFQTLSLQLNTAAFIHPGLLKDSRSMAGMPLSFTDSQMVVHSLNLLDSATDDSVNNQIIKSLHKNIGAELAWILNSNVSDSIINHKAPGHLASLQVIDSLIKKGMARTNFLLNYHNDKLSKATSSMGMHIIIFVVLVGIVLTYALINFSRLKTKNEKKFRALVEHGQDIILLTTREGKVIFVSSGMERLTGFTLEDLMGKNIIMIMDPAYRNAAKAVFEKLLKNPGMSIPGNNRLICKNGSHIDVEGTVTNLLDDENVGAVVTNFRDITQRKLEQEKLASSESRFRSLIENSTDVILMLDNNFKVIYRSPSSERVTGWSDADMMGKDGLYYIHHDDRPLAKKIFTEILSNPGIPAKFSSRTLHKNGHYIWIGGSATNLLLNEHIKALVFNFRDITEQKEAREKLVQSEQIYRTIASSIPGSVICLMDTNFKYYLIEGDILEKIGYTKEMLLGKTLEEALTPEVYASVKTQFDQVKQGEIVTHESDSNGYDIISRFIPLKDENDNVYAIMTVSLDITEIKDAQRKILAFNDTLEQKIIERTSQLEAANKELQQFAYIASHDLQQPLRTVSNYMHIFEEDYIEQLDDNARKYLASVNKATRRMSNLINSLLDFTKLTHSKKLTYVDCNQLIADVIADLNMIIQDSNAIIEVSSMPHLNLYDIEIRQLFQNLILNAIKFHVNGNQPLIKIYSENMNSKWKFSVSDNGIGIDPAFFDRIFNIFQRLDSNSKYEGNGIGLANCKKIVQLHHGEIWVESIKGKGSIFHFTIPNITV